ncbi:MAG: CHAD domain-containing protein [Ignavibacteria bacterium]|nr:CHAD domain-containing protein [Ignavibacteria bacterium]
MNESFAGNTLSRRRPGDPLEVLLDAFEVRWKKYRKELQRCKKQCSEESVHDLRVATRRLVGWIDVILITTPDKRLKKVRQMLKKQFDVLSPLRDIQVQILSVKTLLSRHPQLEPFLTILLLREQQLLKRIGRIVAAAETRAMSGVFASVKRTMRSRLMTPAFRQAFHTALHGAAAGAFTRSIDCLRKIDPGNAGSIHQLRVSFKKFRYLVEMLGPLLGVTKEQLKAMNAYQVKMGDVQDIEVLIGSINGFTLRRRRVRTVSLLPLHQELARQRAERIDAFMRSSEELLTFWKDAAATVTPTEDIVSLNIHSRPAKE